MTLLDQPAPAARALDRHHRAITIGLLALVTMFAFEAVAVSLAMPAVARELDGTTLYPIAVVGLLTAAIVGMVVGGIWSDARGPALPITAGGAVFVVGLLLSGFAATMEVFVLGRLLQGLGCGAALTAMYVVVGDAYPQALRLVVAAVAAVSVAGVRVAVGRRLAVRTAPLEWGRRPWFATVAAVAVVLLHLAGHAHSLRAVALLLAGLALLGWAVPPLLPRGTLRAAAGLPAVVAARAVFGAAFVCVEMFLPLVLQDESGLSPTVTGLVMMVGALGWTAGSAYSGRHGRSDTFGPLLWAGALTLLGGAVALTALVPIDHLAVPAAALATVGFTVMAVGMGLATPLMSTLALDLAAQGRQGESGAAIQMSDALGQSIAAGVVGAVFARWFLLDPDSSYLAGFGLAVLLGVTALWTVRRARV
jgi:MFS family permease